MLTVSAGLAVIDPVNLRSTNEVVSDADQALYRAKQRGRTRVEIATFTPVPV